MMFLMLLRGGDFFDLIEGGVAILVLAGLLAVTAWAVTRNCSLDGASGQARQRRFSENGSLGAKSPPKST